MKKILAALAALALLPTGAFAHSHLITKGFYTMDSMGCMLLRECTQDIEEVFSIIDISSKYRRPWEFNGVAKEFNEMLVILNKIGVKVYIADERYFPVGHRGVYHTIGNNFFLNKTYMRRPEVLISVMRHEGWHAAQDCMAGSIDNGLIAVIKNEEDVPDFWRDVVERTYPPEVVAWEAEATWAGKIEGMTKNALKACATGRMWEIYPPTPLTKEYLIKNGYIKKE